MIGYEKYACELTDAPPIFHRFVGLFILGIAVGNKRYYMYGDEKMYPNLWMILIAPSSEFRKSTCLNIGKRLLDRSLVFPARFSEESITDLLSKQATGAFFYSEFMSFMGLLEKNYMKGAKSFFTELYDNPAYYNTLLRSRQSEAKDVCVGFISATTKEWFLKSTKEADLMAGLLPRFLFVPAFAKNRTMAIPPAVDIEVKDRLYHQLHAYQDIKEGQMQLSSEATEEYGKWYGEHSKLYHSTLGAFYRRIETYCIKFALLFQLDLDKVEKVISLEAMKNAIKICNWLTRQLDKLYKEEFTFTQYQQDRMKVIKLLERKGKMSKSEILNSIKLPLRSVNEILSTLIEEEKIVGFTQKVEGTYKPKMMYEWQMDK